MILGALGKILGSDKVIESGLKLIDDMHTSEAEGIQARTQAKAQLLQSYAPFKVAQRWLALLFGVTYVSCFILVLVMTLTGSAVSEVMDQFSLNYSMMIILGFYFGSGAVEGVLSKRNSTNGKIG